MASDTPDPAALARELIDLYDAVFVHQTRSANAWRVFARFNAATVARWALQLEAVVKDGCETEAEARQIAASVLGDAKANGDRYGVPGVADLMEMMRERVAALENQLEKWTDLRPALLVPSNRGDDWHTITSALLYETEELLESPT